MRPGGLAYVRRFSQAVARAALGRAYPQALGRWRRAQGAWRGRRVEAVTRRFAAWHGLEVGSGPFAGMVYPDLTPSFLVPKLLGVYERELHAAIEAAIRGTPEVIVNVGAADGYYAVGLARRCPSARVHAFDIDARERDRCARLAAANGVEDRVHVEGAAGPERLRAVLSGRALLVMDCEGCELGLLRPDEVPALRDATVVVELHDFLEPGLGDTVTARFADTHEIAVIPTGPQPPRRGSDLALALSEYRPGPMRWAVMTPAAGG
jgi:hypothetical protein